MAAFPYPGKYTFVDVEIPNLYNDCICAISMIVIEDGQEVVRVTEYINPKTFFSPNNIRIHHIRREDVKNARTLGEFWKDYGQYFEKPYIIGAHNVMSDVSVLNKDLARFHTEIHAVESIDTMDIVENFYYKGDFKTGDLKLCNIATKLGIELDHHNPESDVNACYEIVRYMHDKMDMDLTPFIKPIRKTRLKPSKHKMSTSQIRTFYRQAQRQIDQQASKVSLSEAKARGDEAMEWKDYELAILYYELAVFKEWPTSSVYLRLAKLYEKFNLNHEAIQVLEKGIQVLKKNHQNWYDLLARQKKIRDKKQKKTQSIQSQPNVIKTSGYTHSSKRSIQSLSNNSTPKAMKRSSKHLSTSNHKEASPLERGENNTSSFLFFKFSSKDTSKKENKSSQFPKHHTRTQRVLKTVREVLHIPKKREKERYK